MLNNTHTYTNILHYKEWVLDYPSYDDLDKCSRTIQVNYEETDEIEASGFTCEKSKTVSVPRIAESLYSLECSLLWDKPLIDNSRWHLFCGKVQHVAIDEKALVVKPSERMNNLNLMYNVRGTVNPLNGEYHGANTIGLLKKFFDFSSIIE